MEGSVFNDVTDTLVEMPILMDFTCGYSQSICLAVFLCTQEMYEAVLSVFIAIICPVTKRTPGRH
jgi:ABC-type enterobactin transport system permease subunit